MCFWKDSLVLFLSYHFEMNGVLESKLLSCSVTFHQRATKPRMNPLDNSSKTYLKPSFTYSLSLLFVGPSFSNTVGGPIQMNGSFEIKVSLLAHALSKCHQTSIWTHSPNTHYTTHTHPSQATLISFCTTEQSHSHFLVEIHL